MTDAGFRISDYVSRGPADLFTHKFGPYRRGNIAFLAAEVGAKHPKKPGLSLVAKPGDGFEVSFRYPVKNLS